MLWKASDNVFALQFPNTKDIIVYFNIINMYFHNVAETLLGYVPLVLLVLVKRSTTSEIHPTVL